MTNRSYYRIGAVLVAVILVATITGCATINEGQRQVGKVTGAATDVVSTVADAVFSVPATLLGSNRVKAKDIDRNFNKCDRALGGGEHHANFCMCVAEQWRTKHNLSTIMSWLRAEHAKSPTVSNHRGEYEVKRLVRVCGSPNIL